MDSQVLIIGGGPSGSSAAYALAKQGIDVRVIEKHTMPRYKTCGGGVNVRAANVIPFSIEPVIEQTINRYRFTYRGARQFERSYPEPLTYMTQRSRLDQYLLERAKEAGAEVIEGSTVRRVTQSDSGVVVTLDSGKSVNAQVVVGADGANSVVARDLGLMGDVRRELALESEIPLSTEALGNWRNTIEIDLFSVRFGYGWVFPKQHHISIGVGGLKEEVKRIQQYNGEYLHRHAVDSIPPLRFSGHALPVRNGNASVVRDRGVLVGDAAGLLEPFTGEGIGYAVRSGQLAAEAIGSFLCGEVSNLQPYASSLDAEITPDLIDAQRFIRIFNRFPRLFYRLIRDNDSVWKAICLILRGERGFSDVNRKLGVLKYALTLF